MVIAYCAAVIVGLGFSFIHDHLAAHHRFDRRRIAVHSGKDGCKKK
jgi:hypothetical protein